MGHRVNYLVCFMQCLVSLDGQGTGQFDRRVCILYRLLLS